MSRSAVLHSHRDLPPPPSPQEVSPPPPPPARRRQAPPIPVSGNDFESRFRFHLPTEFPVPEPMVVLKKIYPSQIAAKENIRRSSTKKTRAPPPPPDVYDTPM